MKRLLFICLGNICRSPAAEGVMRQMVSDAGWGDSIVVDSAGIGSWHVGEQPDRRMIKHARQRGYDLSVLRARQFSSDDFHRFDYIVVMDEENYCDVMARRPEVHSKSLLMEGESSVAQKDKVTSVAQVLRMRDYFTRHTWHTTVPDPYYGGADGFELALDLIEDGCRGLLDSLTGRKEPKNK